MCNGNPAIFIHIIEGNCLQGTRAPRDQPGLRRGTARRAPTRISGTLQAAANAGVVTLRRFPHKATLKNGPCLQSLRCARKFYPRNINKIPQVKFPHAPRPWRKNLIFQGSHK